MQHLLPFSVFEHHAGLEQLPTGNTYSKIWSRYERENKRYLKSKGLSADTIKYWTRPDEGEHQENIQLFWFYNEVILGRFKFHFSEGFMNTRDFYSAISDKTSAERQRKWRDSILSGVDYFRGIPVQGSTPAERQAYLESSTRDWLISLGRDRSKPICLTQPWDQPQQWILVDGGHRLWAARELFPQGIPLYTVLVREEKL